MQDAISIGDTFRTTLEVIQRNLATLGAMVFIIACFSFGFAMAQSILTSALIPGFGTEASDDPFAVLSGFAILVPFLLVATPITMLVYALVQAAMTYAAVEHMAGRSTDPVSALGTAARSIFGLLGVQIVIGLVSVVGLTISVLPGVVLWAATESSVIGVLALLGGLTLAVVPAMVLAVQYSVVMPVVVVERVGPIRAFSRSGELTSGNRINIFLVFLVYTISAMAVTACVMMPIFGAVAAALVMSGDPQSMSDPLNPATILYQGANSAFTACTSAVGTTLVAVMYARLRGIKDGVDAEAFAQVFA